MYIAMYKEMHLSDYSDMHLHSFSTPLFFQMLQFLYPSIAAKLISSFKQTVAVGKISRRVCLRHYPEPDELERPSFSNLNLSSQRGNRYPS